MIPFEFSYFKPATIAEAIETFHHLNDSGKKVVYYSGGTEFITFARGNKLNADAVIDIKGIPECNIIAQQADQVIIGAAVTLNKITAANLFPLLGQTIKNIADHTSRNKITIGGNINSQLMYKEGILPLIVADAKVKIARPKGEEVMQLAAIFNQEIKLDVGDFISQIMIDQSFIDLPFYNQKKTRITKVGYPLVSVAALRKNKQIQVAFSGVCAYPFRSTEIEAILNDSSLSADERIHQAVKDLPEMIVEDVYGSAKYREFVFKNVLQNMLDVLEGA